MIQLFGDQAWSDLSISDFSQIWEHILHLQHWNRPSHHALDSMGWESQVAEAQPRPTHFAPPMMQRRKQPSPATRKAWCSRQINSKFPKFQLVPLEEPVQSQTKKHRKLWESLCQRPTFHEDLPKYNITYIHMYIYIYTYKYIYILHIHLFESSVTLVGMTLTTPKVRKHEKRRPCLVTAFIKSFLQPSPSSQTSRVYPPILRYWGAVGRARVWTACPDYLSATPTTSRCSPPLPRPWCHGPIIWLVSLCLSLYIYIYVHISTYACIYIYICVCVYIIYYIYITYTPHR